MKFKMMNVGHFALLAILLGGCDRTESDWKQAKDSNTAAAYTDFIAKHPQGSHVDEARAAIENLDWDTAKAADTTDAYTAYLAKYPQGMHANDVKSSIENLNWSNAKSTATAAAYQEYLQRYPNGRFVLEAKAVLDEQAWRTAQTSDTDQSYRAYVSAHPGGKYEQDAQKRVDDIAFASARKKGSTKAFAEYVDHFSSGLHVQEAKHQLLSLRAEAKAAEIDAAVKHCVESYFGSQPAANSDVAIRLFDGHPFDDLVHGKSIKNGGSGVVYKGTEGHGWVLEKGFDVTVRFFVPGHPDDALPNLVLKGVSDGNGGFSPITTIQVADGVVVVLTDGSQYRRSTDRWAIIEGATTNP
jgi:hypothetical protein